MKNVSGQYKGITKMNQKMKKDMEEIEHKLKTLFNNFSITKNQYVENTIDIIIDDKKFSILNAQDNIFIVYEDGINNEFFEEEKDITSFQVFDMRELISEVLNFKLKLDYEEKVNQINKVIYA